jgi:hypothetical protein
MHSSGHALVSAVLAGAVILAIPPPVHPAIAALVVLGVGIGIDLDHVVLAVANTGSTRPIRRVLRRPAIVLLDQEAIFEPGELTAPGRLLSHAVLGGVAVSVLWNLSRYWAFVVGVTVYVHVLADLYGDPGAWDTVE